MSNINSYPNEIIASLVTALMTGEKVESVTRMKTGDQNFVFAVTTTNNEYVIRMTDATHKYKFIAALAWQEKLIPLGVPLAKFIDHDLDNKYSPFPALLMKRLPGDDLCNIYSNLTEADKKNLAKEMVRIQALTTTLPHGLTFGIADNYEQVLNDKSWNDFIHNRLVMYKNQITAANIFDPALADQVIFIAKKIDNNFKAIKSTPFLWDASERNVLVHNGKISGIVDVDEICFGDSLLVIALTHTCLKLEGLDTLYTDFWAQELHLNSDAQDRLNFYYLFYVIAFMRKHALQTINGKKNMFEVDMLVNMFHEALQLQKQ